MRTGTARCMRESRKLYFRGGYLERKCTTKHHFFGVQMSILKSAQSILAKFVRPHFFLSQGDYRNWRLRIAKYSNKKTTHVNLKKNCCVIASVDQDRPVEAEPVLVPGRSAWYGALYQALDISLYSLNISPNKPGFLGFFSFFAFAFIFAFPSKLILDPLDDDLSLAVSPLGRGITVFVDWPPLDCGGGI